MIPAILTNLLVIKEFERFEEHGVPLRVFCDTGFDDCLDQERRVPGLDAVGAVHHETLLVHPEEVVQALEVLTDGPGGGAFANVAG